MVHFVYVDQENIKTDFSEDSLLSPEFVDKYNEIIKILMMFF